MSWEVSVSKDELVVVRARWLDNYYDRAGMVEILLDKEKKLVEARFYSDAWEPGDICEFVLSASQIAALLYLIRKLGIEVACDVYDEDEEGVV
jgi:hypothetical protein